MVNLVSSEAFIRVLQMATFLLCPLIVFFCAHTSLGFLCTSKFYHKDNSQTGPRPTRMISFNLIYPLNGLIFQYSHILGYWKLGLQYMDFRGTHNAI